MEAFALTPDIVDLQDAATRFGQQRLAPSVRDHEAAGSWPADVVDIVRDFSAGADPLAKVVMLETLAMFDAGGLPGADIDGPAAAAGGPGWLLVPPTGGPMRVEWAPGWPPISRVWVSDGDDLRLLDASGAPATPVDALAFHASGGVSLDLAGCPVLDQRTLPAGGGVAVRGWARLWCAAIAVGVAQSAFEATIAYTTERMVFGKPVAYHQGNAFALAGLATDIHGARLAVRDAATASDDDGGFSATQAFLTAVDTAVAVTDAGIQLLGGHGFLVDHLAEKRFREARMLGLLFGGRDAAEADAAALVLDRPGFSC